MDCSRAEVRPDPGSDVGLQPCTVGARLLVAAISTEPARVKGAGSKRKPNFSAAMHFSRRSQTEAGSWRLGRGLAPLGRPGLIDAGYARPDIVEGALREYDHLLRSPSTFISHFFHRAVGVRS
jgi:hypothetical protein